MLTFPIVLYVSFTAMGEIATEPTTSVVFGSIVSFKVTPVASAVPVLEMTIVYIKVSPGWAEVFRLSVLVAVIVGDPCKNKGQTSRLTVAERRENTAAGDKETLRSRAKFSGLGEDTLRPDLSFPD